jgi:hypothetical protein
MQPIPNDVHGGDVWQWLNRGWFIHKRDGACVPARLEDVNGDEFVVVRVDGEEYPYERDECFPHWPDCGAINLVNFAVILVRESSRQYRRTYNSRCVSLDIPRKWDIMKTHPWVKSISPDHPEVVSAAFEPKYHSYTRALELLASSWQSVALNPHLVVAGTQQDHAVYYRGDLIAQVCEGQVKPLDPSHPRGRRILKWLDGRVTYAEGC